MLDVDGELPYAVWYQCKTCTHLFYNEESKILTHLAEKHGYDLLGQRKTPTFQPKSVKSIPLKIKEQHFRPVVPSTSSGTDGDGEDTYADDIINNNSTYPTNLTTFPKRKARYFLKDETFGQLHHHNQNHHDKLSQNQIQITRSRNNNNPVQVIPSIEDLKKQLMKSDIDISEIKLSSHSHSHSHSHSIPQTHSQHQNTQIQIPRQEEYEHEHEVEDYEEAEEAQDEVDGDGEIEEGIEYNEEEMMEVPGYGFNSEEYDEQDQDPEENSEDPEEGASTSNQSFYDNDNDMGDHFLLKTDDSESNYDDGGIMTPNFSMVDELYRANLNLVGEAGAEISPTSSSGRKRTHVNPCKLCKRNFPSLSMLKKHAKTHLNDDGGSTHVCKFCFDYFPTAAGLSKHLRVHSKENPNVCRVCQKSFTSWATLRTHLKIHSGERPFGCDQCGQRFQTKSTLDSHLRIHSGSRPHICPICSKSFRTSSPLYRHMRSVHKGMTVSPTDS